MSVILWFETCLYSLADVTSVFVVHREGFDFLAVSYTGTVHLIGEIAKGTARDVIERIAVDIERDARFCVLRDVKQVSEETMAVIDPKEPEAPEVKEQRKEARRTAINPRTAQPFAINQMRGKTLVDVIVDAGKGTPEIAMIFA